MKKMWEKVLLFVWLWCIIILSFIILTVRRIFMINFLNTAAQMVAAKSTIMAAISAMSSAEGKKLVLKSVKTAKPQRPAWSTAGIIDNTRPF